MLTSTKTTDTLHLIRCIIGQQAYGLDTSWVRSVQRTDVLLINSELKRDKTGFVGWLSSNEGDIPVFNMAERLGQDTPSQQDSAEQRIIILPSPTPTTTDMVVEGQPWGLLVDDISRVIEVPEDCLNPLPAITINPATNYFEGVVRLEDDNMLLMLSPEWLHPDTAPPEKFTSEKSKLQARSNFYQNQNSSPPPEAQEQITNGGQAKGLRQANGLQARKSTTAKNGRLILFSTTKSQPNERPLLFALSITQILEALKPLPLIPIPTAPCFVLGLVNWRNQPVPIINLDARLGIELPPHPALNDQTRLLIIRGFKPHTFAGFLVRMDMRALPLPIPHKPSTRTLTLDQTLIYSAVELVNETVIIPDLSTMLEL